MAVCKNVILLKATASYPLEGKWGLKVIAVNTDLDHVHILFSANPKVQLTKVVNSYKTVTSRYLRKEFTKELSNFYWKDVFWSESYFISSVSENTRDVILEYIENQGKS